MRSSVPEDVESEILEAYREIEAETWQGCKGVPQEQRAWEDAAGTTFAGQFRSILNVGADHLIDAYKEVVASKYGCLP